MTSMPNRPSRPDPTTPAAVGAAAVVPAAGTGAAAPAQKVAAAGVPYATPTGSWIVVAAVLGSGMAMLDGTVVNVALKVIGTDLGASLQELQWVTNAYLLALASLILLGGSLGDRFGRRRVFVIGVAWFAAASLLCGLAQNPTQLIAARALQGVGGALLTPGSLSMIQGGIAGADRGKAIGAWSGLGGVAAAIGPFIGGGLVQFVSWRYVFLINVPLAVVTILIAVRKVPETADPGAAHHFDVTGAVLATGGLAAVTLALVEASTLPAGWLIGIWVVGLAALAAFLVVEGHRRSPMMPTQLFRSLQFSAANAMTLVTYAALGAMIFFLVLQLQIGAGYLPLLAGVATLPITVLMLLFAAKGGELSARIGPRLPMTVGPLFCAAGAALLIGIDAGTSYWTGVLPGLVLFGIGLVFLVAPLTATVLAAAPDHNAGIASGINNAVARAGSLLAVAALPAVVGLNGEDYLNVAVFGAGYRGAMLICVVLLVAGAVVSALLIRNPGAAAPSTPT